jgi:chromosomal replication initiation ATPase DnaA
MLNHHNSRHLSFRTTMVLIEEAARLLGLGDPMLLVRRSRERRLSRPRFGVIWAMRQLNWSYPEIAKQLRFEDHKSVMYGHSQALLMREADPVFREYTDQLLRHARASLMATAEAA